MIKALFKPLRYLSIRADDSGGKFKTDIMMPLLVALVLSSLFVYLKINYRIHLFITDELLTQNIIGLLQTLPGFYIASLAAISTFPSTSMDQDMPDPTPYLGKKETTTYDGLTRRRFLSYMFSYLAYISIITLLSTSAIVFMYSNKILESSVFFSNASYFLSCLITFFLITQIIFLTFVGLWYLGERIHLNDAPDLEDD